MLAFNTLNNRYILRGILQFDTAAHIGSGLGNQLADSLFVRSNDTFYVPGSSLRGALRSTVDRVAAGLTAGVGSALETTCFLDTNGGSRCFSARQGRPEDLEKWHNERRPDKFIFEQMVAGGHLCRVCRLFGSPYMASKLKVLDSFPTASLPSRGSIRTGIGIDRDTEAVREGVLFEVEVLDTQPAFQVEIMAENLETENPDDWGLLALGILEMTRESFYLGAKSASGLGKCHLIRDSIMIEGFEGPEQLKNFVTDAGFAQKYDHASATTAMEFLKRKLTLFLDSIESKPTNPSDSASAKKES
ncbi:MAG: RAMP superfamily CRISPR-associated protein [bacterium]